MHQTTKKQVNIYNSIPNLFKAIQNYDRGHLIIIAIFILLIPLSTPRIALSDEVQYYAYLRSLYFDHDLDFRNEYQHFADLGRSHGDLAVGNALLRFDESNPNPATGLLRNVAPVGSAIMWSPGFVIADIGVRAVNLLGANIPADGYSAPYIDAVCFMSALYSLLGLLLSYRLVVRHTDISQSIAVLATVTVWLASPLLFYTYIAMPWSHATGFFLTALFLSIWLGGSTTDPVQRETTRPILVWAILGVIGGLMVMTREQLGLLLIIPAFSALIGYISVVRQRTWKPIGPMVAGHVIFIVSLVLSVTPQMLAYQVLNGHPGPASIVGQKLNLMSPHFLSTLIDPAHGAFLWSPAVMIGVLGLFWLSKTHKLLAAALFLGFLGQVYINGSFSTWHLSGAFGFRRLIECTPIFIFGLAACMQSLQSRIGIWMLVLLSGLLIYWNIGLIAQWAFIRPQELRPGLVWHNMLYYQFVEVPRQIFTKLYLLLFDRCQFLRNCRNPA